MKKLIQLIIFCSICINAFAQNKINQYEYWFDNSYNTKITTNITPIKDFEFISDISPSTLSDGLHTIHFRFKDSQNNYSSAISKYFMKVNPSQLLSDKKITAYEYWYDNNYDLKVFRSFVPTKNFALNTMLDVNPLSEGIHTITTRFLDNSGNWSSLTTNYFYKKEKILTNNLIEAYEYWFDNQNHNRNLVVIYPTNESELIVDINTYGLTSTQPKFHIRFKDTRGNWSSVFTKTFIKTSIGSPTVNLTTRIVDPNPSLIDGTGNLIDNPTIAASITTTRIGACVDGITKLLLITESPIPITYKILRNNLLSIKDGTLGTLSSPNQGLNIINISPVIVNGKSLCIAVYNVPYFWDESITSNNYREVDIRVSSSNTTDNYVGFSLRPPPLMLIHGMWGGKESWDDGFKTYLLNYYSKDFLFVFDYSGRKSVSSFNPYNPNNIVLDDIKNYQTEIYQSIKKKGFAISQIDVVAHSLGGLMIKSFIKTNRFIYKNKENLYKGYVHRLITIGTPHKGSPLGPAYFSANLNPFYYVIFNNGMKELPIGPCHLEFNANSTAIQNLQNTEVTTHAIVASHKPNLSSRQFLYFGPVGIFYPIFQGVDNDLIVTVPSQTGGLLNSSITQFSSISHSMPFNPDSSRELSSNRIMRRTKELLFTNNNLLFSSTIPGISSNEEISTLTSTINHYTPNNSSEIIKIATPLTGSEFNLNAFNQFTLSIDTINSDIYNDAFFYNSDLGVMPLDSGKIEYQTNLPLNFTLGKQTFYLIATDNNGDIMVDSSIVTFNTETPIEEFSVIPKNVKLDSIHNYLSLNVSGYYFQGDTSSVINLTNERSGTKYTTLNGTQVISIKNGEIIAKSIGTDTITVTFENNKIKVPVTVTSIKSPSTGIEGENNQSKYNELIYNISTYPNPFSESITLAFGLRNNSEINLQLFNILGQQVYSKNIIMEKGNQNYNISTKELGEGIYLYRITTNGQSIGGKIIKISM